MNVELERVSARHPAARAGAPEAVRVVDLKLTAGEHIAVIGPSGAGKTTLLQILACALRPQHGTLRLDHQSPWSMSQASLQALRRTLFLAPQVPPLPPRQRVVTAVLAGRLPTMSTAASLRSLFYPVDIPAAHEALEQFDLAEKLFDRVDRLSGGERQRVGLARALLAPAKLWLIDEPLSALDPTRARQAVVTLTTQARARGCTLVTTLHDVPIALAHFPRILALRDGAVAFDRPATEVTPRDLAELYVQHEDELRGGPVEVIRETPVEASPPAVMHCR